MSCNKMRANKRVNARESLEDEPSLARHNKQEGSIKAKQTEINLSGVFY